MRRVQGCDSCDSNKFMASRVTLDALPVRLVQARALPNDSAEKVELASCKTLAELGLLVPGTANHLVEISLVDIDRDESPYDQYTKVVSELEAI